MSVRPRSRVPGARTLNMTGPENLTVEMVRRSLASLPDRPLPPGFALRPFTDGDEPIWTDLIRASEPFFLVRDDLYASQFGHDPAGARERIGFVTEAATGRPVATVSAWYGEERHGDRAGWGRIHWVATHPEFQGRGIGEAMTALALHRLAALGPVSVFLVRQR